MAKYSVNYTCGHKDEVELFGKYSLRDERIKWLENNAVCPECYRAAKEAERARATQAAAEKNKGLPQLEGSEKQIAWAETIRAGKMEEAKAVLERSLSAATDEQKNIAQLVSDIYKKWESTSSAKWWIENRSKDFMSEVREEYKLKA